MTNPRKPLKKAIFPVAGLGTRFLPATKSVPKEMLTVVDRPLIHYAVTEAVEAGCTTLIFVTGRSKRSIEDYFDRSPELEHELESQGKTQALEIVRSILPAHVSCFYVRQMAPLGLGHAVACAADLIEAHEPFAVLLPDDLIDTSGKGVLAQMAAIHDQTQQSVLAVEQVAWEAVERYGVIKPKQATTPQPHTPIPLEGIVEKPKREQAPSNWTVVGRYILSSTVMQALKTQEAGTGGEIQLTDAIATAMQTESFLAHPVQGKRFDCGNEQGFLNANIHFAFSKKGLTP